MKKAKMLSIFLVFCFCVGLLCFGVFSVKNYALDIQGDIDYTSYKTTVVTKAYRSNTQTLPDVDSFEIEAKSLENKTHSTLTGVTEYGSTHQSSFVLYPINNESKSLEQWDLAFDVTSATKTYSNFYVIEITNSSSKTAYAYFQDNTSSEISENFYTYISDRASINVGETKTLVVGYALKDSSIDITSLKLNITLSVTYIPGLETKFLKSNKFLYRVGNQNNIEIGTIFEEASPIDATTPIDVKITKINSNTNVNGIYTPDATDWKKGTIKFSGTGPARISTNGISQIVEVINAENITSISQFVADEKNTITCNNDIVLLNDIKIIKDGIFILNEGTTLYGNNFTFDISEGTIAPKQHGIIELYGATIDNVKIIGSVYTTYAGVSTSEYFSAAVYVNGRSTISNSYIANCRACVRVHAGVVCDIINTTLDGGCYANLDIQGGTTANLTNVTTVNMARDGVVGLGIVIGADSISDAKLNISGTFTQYNWISKDDGDYVSGEASSLFDEAFTNADLASMRYTYNGVEYINTGILCMSIAGVNSSNITGLPVSYIEKSVKLLTYTGWIKSFDMTNSINQQMFTNGLPTYSGDYAPTKQGEYKPTFNWNYPIGYNKSENKVRIVINSGEQYVYDPNFLTPVKHGNLLPMSVKMNNTDYTGKTITFTENGDYTFVYTIVDEYNYSINGKANSTQVYTIELVVNVSVVNNNILAPEISFVDKNSKKYNSKIHLSSDGFKYAMPDVNDVEDGVIGSVVVGDDVFYYPIIKGYNVSGSGDFSRYFSLYGGVSIKNYTNATGAYDVIDSTLQTAYDGYEWVKECGIEAHGDKHWAGYGYYSSNGGYARKTNAIATSNIYNQEDLVVYWVLYSFRSGRNETVYFYIGYEFEKMGTSGSCVTEDTLITLSDGTQKRVDQLTGEELLLVWNLETGSLDSAPIMFIDSEEIASNEVVHLYFSDGTDVKVVYEHGFWDYDLNRYVYLDNNAAQYIGHIFAKQDGDKLTKVKLVDVVIKTETTKAYSPVTVGHLCYFVNGMLSMPGGVGGLFNIFDVDAETMTYDYESIQRDIEKYGLFTYEEINEIVPLSEEMFIAAGGQYLKISIGKGNMTINDLIEMVNRYSKYI